MRRLITTRTALVVACSGILAAALASAPVAGARPAANPGALVGAWKRVVTQPDIDRTASFREEPQGWSAPVTGPYTLVLASGSFSVRDKTGFAVAETTRVDSGGAFDVLAYISPDIGAFCPQWIPQNASYTWAMEGSDLILTANDDKCSDRSSILAGRWARGSNVRTIVARNVSMRADKRGFSFGDKLTEGGTAAGTDAGRCAFVSKKTAECRVTLRLADGTVVLRGKINLAKPISRLEITGGTGAYAGAKGSLIAKEQGKTKMLFTIHFT